MRQILFASAATLLPVLLAHNAAAHAVLETPEARAGGYKAVVTIPHGCDGEATNSVRVDIPEGFVSVKPMPKPGWTLSIEEGAYAKPYEVHGESVERGVTAVTWSGGALPDAQFDEFALRGTLAGVEPGQKLFFKTLQSCASGEVAWIEIPAEGQDAHALAHPAPSLTVLASGTGAAGHHDHAEQATVAGALKISAARARAMLPGQPAGGGYLTVENTGTEDDRLLAVATPAAGRAEIHTMEMKDDVMVMRPVEGGLAIPAGETVELKPGGLHLMFMEVTAPFREGSTVPVTLEFEKAGKAELMLQVGPARGGMAGGGHSDHDH